MQRLTATRNGARTSKEAPVCGFCEREPERDLWEDVDVKVDAMKEAKRLGNEA